MIEVGTLINERYKVSGIIGHGGVCDVYEVRDIIFRRHVALKILNNENYKRIDSVIRFENEARFQSSLDHPNIVKIYDYGDYEGYHYCINELVKGQTLRDSLDFKRTYSLKEACSIMIQLCDCIGYIHSKNIIHRDIKSSNIFILNDGSIKVGDFGISVLLNSDVNINENSKVSGTPQYLAPELIKGEDASIQSDIYALGILFYELLSGNVPFDGNTTKEIVHKHLNNSVPKLSKAYTNIPKEIDAIISKATAKNPKKRYKNCEEMQNDILNIYENKKKIKPKGNIFARFFGLKSE